MTRPWNQMFSGLVAESHCQPLDPTARFQGLMMTNKGTRSPARPLFGRGKFGYEQARNKKAIVVLAASALPNCLTARVRHAFNVILRNKKNAELKR